MIKEPDPLVVYHSGKFYGQICSIVNNLMGASDFICISVDQVTYLNVAHLLKKVQENNAGTASKETNVKNNNISIIQIRQLTVNLHMC